MSIEEINPHNFKDINQCNGEFSIDSRLVLTLKNNVLHYTIHKIPATRKRYPIDEVDYSAYINQIDKAVFLAYVEGQIAGQLILRRNWNNYALIDDIIVDIQYRRQGIGRELVSCAVEWARKRNLRGIMLETQDNNVPACKFYNSCGFHLRGFDTDLYKGIDPNTDEIALYWYYIFE